MNGRIFINYRREDDQAAAGRLYDRLLQHFDREQLFVPKNYAAGLEMHCPGGALYQPRSIKSR